VRASSAGFSARTRRFCSFTPSAAVAGQRASDSRLLWKRRPKCKVNGMTDLPDDIRYTPDLELRSEPQLGRFTIAELRSFIPYVGADGADLSWWERCCSGRAALSDPGDSCDT
jgi:hypothetical protein